MPQLTLTVAAALTMAVMYRQFASVSAGHPQLSDGLVSMSSHSTFQSALPTRRGRAGGREGGSE